MNFALSNAALVISEVEGRQDLVRELILQCVLSISLSVGWCGSRDMMSSARLVTWVVLLRRG